MTGTHLRVVVLVDGDNLEIDSEGGPRRRIKYSSLLEKMNGRELVRAIYYRPGRTLPVRHRRIVERAGFEVKATYKNSDPWFICDAMAFARKYDCVLFVGGDGDLEPVIPMLKSLGVLVEVWSWEEAVSDRVRALANKFVCLDNLGIELLERRPGGGDDDSRGSQRAA